MTAPELVRGAAQFEHEGVLYPECRRYSKKDIFAFNQFAWALGYVFFGIQFTHSDQGILQQFVLDWNVMKHWPAVLWVVFCGLVVLIATLGVVVIKVYTASDCLWIYGLWAVLLLGFITFKKYTAKDMHVHHYALTSYILSFIGY